MTEINITIPSLNENETKCIHTRFSTDPDIPGFWIELNKDINFIDENIFIQYYSIDDIKELKVLIDYVIKPKP